MLDAGVANDRDSAGERRAERTEGLKTILKRVTTKVIVSTAMSKGLGQLMEL